MGLLLLDSTVLIDVLRGRPAADRLLALRRTSDSLCTSAINVEEIVRGLRDSEQRVADRLFTGLEVLPIGQREAETAGRWRREHAGRGVTLHQANCLIAAAAHLRGARLATGNPADFPVAELLIEHWPVGR